MQTLDIALLQPNTIWHDPQANQELIARLHEPEKAFFHGSSQDISKICASFMDFIECTLKRLHELGRAEAPLRVSGDAMIDNDGTPTLFATVSNDLKLHDPKANYQDQVVLKMKWDW